MAATLAALIVLGLPYCALGDGTSAVKGRFAFLGEAPPDTAALRVDPATRGIENVLVYSRPQSDVSDEPARAAGTVTLVLDDAGFDKRLVGLVAGQSLTIQCKGNAAHDPVVLIPNRVESPTIRPQRDRTYEFQRDLRYPVPIRCSVHDDERVFVFVHANPHFAITNERGEFSLRGLPQGEHEFQFWHEMTGPLRAQSEWHRGRLRVDLREGGEVDLGEIEVGMHVFEKADGQ